MADRLRPAGRSGQRDPDRDPALVDARTQRHVRAGSGMARGRQNRRHDRQVRLRRAVPAHALAGRASPARSSTPRGSATSAPKGSARCGSTSGCRSRGATTWRTSRSSITPTTPAIHRPGGWMGSWASAPRDRAPATGRSPRARRRSSATSSSIYTGTLNDVEMTNAWAEFSGNRSTLDRAVDDRAEGRAGREVSDARAGGRADDADRRLHRQCLGRRADGGRSRWRSAGTIAGGSGWPRTATTRSREQGFSNAGNSRILILEDTDRDGVADSRKVFMEGIVFPSAIAVGFDGVFIGAPPNLLFVPDRERRRQGRHGGYRSPPHRMGHPRSPRSA